MQQPTAIIIGSGVGGMAAAVRLSLQGFAVSVYEKNAGPGGKLTAFTRNGFHFDAGPSLFTAPQFLEELFNAAGEELSDYMAYQPVDTACKYFFESGETINAFTAATAFAKEAAEKTGEPEENISQYLSRAASLNRNTASVFLNHSLQKRSTWLHPRVFRALGAVRLPYLFSSLARYNERRFKSPQLQQIFNRFATYSGSDPHRAPAMLSLIADMEHGSGTFYPRGGMYSITKALHQLAEKKGVKFYFNSPVSRIIYSANKAKGVVVNGENQFADAVISNADAHFTYKNLVGHERMTARLEKKERSSSAIVFYWGMSKSFPDLDLHNIFFSADYKQEFSRLFGHHELSDDLTVYVNVTSVYEPGHAPAGSSNWFVMVNVPANTAYNEDSLITRTREKILQKLTRILKEDISAYIVEEEVMHPRTISANTNAFEGALYGASSNSRMAAFHRQPNFSSYIKGLYFCGGTVHPGGGIPLCLKSAQITAELVEGDRKKRRR